MKVHSQKVSTYDIVAQTWEVLLKISHTLAVNLYHLEWTRFFNQILRHNTHTRTNLEYRNLRTSIYCISDALGYIQVSQEVLTQIFLRTNLFHAAKIVEIERNTKLKAKKIADFKSATQFFVQLLIVVYINSNGYDQRYS